MEITELLHRVRSGDQEALNAVIPLVYEQLKKIAAARLRAELNRGALETTALVHEAYLRLAAGGHPVYENRTHFYGIASRIMRQILVDFARARASKKRGAREVSPVAIPSLGQVPDETLLSMDQALEKLGQTDPRKARLIEMRYFGGMTAEESAEALSISPHIVRRELRVAQAWLRREISR